MQYKLALFLLVVTSGLQVVSSAAGDLAVDVAQDRRDTTSTPGVSVAARGPQWPTSPVLGVEYKKATLPESDGSDEQQEQVQQSQAVHSDDSATTISPPQVARVSNTTCFSRICTSPTIDIVVVEKQKLMKRLVKITPKRVAGFVVKCVRKAFRCLVNDGARQMGLPDMPSNRVGAEPNRRRTDDDEGAHDQRQPADFQHHVQTKRLVKLTPKRVANFVIRCVRRTFRCLEATEARQLGVHKMPSNRVKPSEERRDDHTKELQQDPKAETLAPEQTKRLVTPKRVAGFAVKCFRRVFRCLVDQRHRNLGVPELPSSRIKPSEDRRDIDDKEQQQQHKRDSEASAASEAPRQLKRLVKITPKRAAGFAVKCLRKVFRCVVDFTNAEFAEPPMRTNRVGASGRRDVGQVQELQDRRDSAEGTASWSLDKNEERHQTKRLVTPKRAANFVMKCARKIGRCFVYLDRGMSGQGPAPSTRVKPVSERDPDQKPQEQDDRLQKRLAQMTPKRIPGFAVRCFRKVGRCFINFDRDVRGHRHLPSTQVKPVERRDIGSQLEEEQYSKRLDTQITVKRVAGFLVRCIRKIGRGCINFDRDMTGRHHLPTARINPVNFNPKRSEMQQSSFSKRSLVEDATSDTAHLPRSFNTEQRRRSMSSWNPEIDGQNQQERRLVTPKRMAGLLVKGTRKVWRCFMCVVRHDHGLPPLPSNQVKPEKRASTVGVSTRKYPVGWQTTMKLKRKIRKRAQTARTPKPTAPPRANQVKTLKRSEDSVLMQTKRFFHDVNETWKRSRRKQCHVRRYDDDDEVEQQDKRLVRTVAKGAIRTAKHFYRGTINKWRDCWYMPPVTSSVAPGSPGPGRREELDATRPTYIPHHVKRGVEVSREYDIDDGEQHSKRLVKTLAKGVRKVYRYVKNRYRVNSHQNAIPPPKVTPTGRGLELDDDELPSKDHARHLVRDEASQDLQDRSELADDQIVLPIKLVADVGTERQGHNASCEAVKSYPPRLEHAQSPVMTETQLNKEDVTLRIPVQDESTSDDIAHELELGTKQQQQPTKRLIQSAVKKVAKALRACAWCAYPFTNDHLRNRPSNRIKHDDDHDDRRRSIKISKRMLTSMAEQDPELANRFFKTAVGWAAKGLRGCTSCFRRCRDDRLFMDPSTNKVKPLELEGRSQCVHTDSHLDHDDHGAQVEQHHQYTKRFFKTALTKLVRGIRGCVSCFRQGTEDVLGHLAPSNKVEPLTSARRRRTMNDVIRDRSLSDDHDERLAKRLLRTAVKAVWRSGRKVGKAIVNRWRVNGFQRPYTSNVAPSADLDRKRGEIEEANSRRKNNGFSIDCPLGSCYKPPRDVRRLKSRAWGVHAAVVSRRSQTIEDEDDKRQGLRNELLSARNESVVDLQGRGILGAFKKGYDKGRRQAKKYLSGWPTNVKKGVKLGYRWSKAALNKQRHPQPHPHPHQDRPSEEPHDRTASPEHVSSGTSSPEEILGRGLGSKILGGFWRGVDKGRRQGQKYFGGGFGGIIESFKEGYRNGKAAWSREVDGIGRPCTSNDYEAFFGDEVPTESIPSETEGMKITSCVASPYADSRMLKSAAKKVVKTVKKVFKPRPRIKRPKSGVMSHNVDADEMMPQPDVDEGRDWFGRDDDGLSHLERRMLGKVFKKMFKSHEKDKSKPKPPTISGKPHRGNLDHGLAHDYLERHKGNPRITVPDDYGQLLNRVKNKIKDKRGLARREASLPSPDGQRRLTKDVLVKSKKQAVKTKKIVVKKVKAGFRKVTGSKPQRIQQEPDPFLPNQGNGFADFYRRSDKRSQRLFSSDAALERRMLDKAKKKAQKVIKAVIKKVTKKPKQGGVQPGDLHRPDTPPDSTSSRPAPPPLQMEAYQIGRLHRRMLDKVKKKAKAFVKKVVTKKDRGVRPNDLNIIDNTPPPPPPIRPPPPPPLSYFENRPNKRLVSNVKKKIKMALKKATQSKVKPQPQRRPASMVPVSWPANWDRRADDEMERRLVKQVKKVVNTVVKKVTGGDKKDKQVKPEGGGHRPVDRQELEWLQNNT